MSERGENKERMSKMVQDLLQAYCREGNIELGQITEDPTNRNENPIEIQKREKAVSKEKKEALVKSKEKHRQKEKDKKKKKGVP